MACQISSVASQSFLSPSSSPLSPQLFKSSVSNNHIVLSRASPRPNSRPNSQASIFPTNPSLSFRSRWQSSPTSFSSPLPSPSPSPVPSSLPTLGSKGSFGFGALTNPKNTTLLKLPAGSCNRTVKTCASQSLQASVEDVPPKKTGFKWEGAKPVPLALSLAVGIILRYGFLPPPGVSTQAWQLLAIFLSTITGLVLSPLPVGAWAFIGLTTAVLTKTLTFVQAFSAFTSDVIWLIVISFFFARGFVKTGLGDRVATYFVMWLGKSTLGLSYGLAVAEALIAPAMPSTTARAGGVFLPIIKSLALAGGSKPNDPSSKKLGAYLVMTQFQCAGNSSALFLTAAAQNLLCLKLAEELGVKILSPWLTWFKLAYFPAFAALLATPLLLYTIFPPETKNTPEAPGIARERLVKMGPVTSNEWVMVGTMLVAVSLWIFGDALGVASVVAAMLGLCILLMTGVLSWDDCLSEKSAWDTLAWFAVLVSMSGQLKDFGIVQWLADSVAKGLGGSAGGWGPSFFKLQLAYFTSHYLFASQTGHVGALFSAFLAMQLSAGVPGVLATLSLAYSTNLFGALTHYSSGQAAVYFGAGYVDLPDIFRIGAITAVVNIFIWVVVAAIWWKFQGLY